MKWPLPLPAPTTFSEGQRSLYGCLVALAGMFAGLLVLLYTAVFVGGVWLKVWPVERYEQIITILGYAMLAADVAMIAVIGTLSVGGPVGRFKGGASLKDGVNLDVESDESAAVTVTTETTTATVTPPPATPPGGVKLP